MQTVYQQFWKQNAEVAQLVERQPSKLNVASSTLVFRSKKSQPTTACDFFLKFCRLSSGVERFLGKEEVVSSNLIVGSVEISFLARRFFVLIRRCFGLLLMLIRAFGLSENFRALIFCKLITRSFINKIFFLNLQSNILLGKWRRKLRYL